MTRPGPPLAVLLRRLSECPEEFLGPLGTARGQGASLAAIVCDTLRTLAPDDPPELHTDRLKPILAATKLPQQMAAIGCWLLAEEWFHRRDGIAKPAWTFLASKELVGLSAVVKPQTVVRDADRREEFARLCLKHLGLRPEGETDEQAEDRLTTLDSVERARVLRQTASAERRAREIREAMAKKAAQDAASRYGE